MDPIALVVGGATKRELLERSAALSVSLNEYAETLFAADEFTTSDRTRVAQLVPVSLADIGLPHGGRYDEVVAAAAERDLVECDLEVAAHLRLHYLDQPEGPYLTVASAKLRDDDAFPNGLYLRKLDGGLWLRGYNAGPENVYAPDFTRFVFARR